MTAAELRSIGESLYGLRWKVRLAEELSVTPRCVRYWLAGERKLHPVFALRIRSLAASQPGGGCE